MKLSELIANMNARLQEVGDVDVEVSVRDYYTTYGHRAEVFPSTPSWNFTTFVQADGKVILQTVLCKQTEMDGTKLKPKVTFRK
jgi:hypothetical protein